MRRETRIKLEVGLMALLGALALPGAVAGKASACTCYHYVGTISQQHQSRFFDLSLSRNPNGGYDFLSRWRPIFSPAQCSKAFLNVPQTTMQAASVHLQTVKPGVETEAVVPRGAGNDSAFIHMHKVTNFKAVFTKGQVAGSFTNDTFTIAGGPNKGTVCSTGAITFTAQRVSF